MNVVGAVLATEPQFETAQFLPVAAPPRLDLGGQLADRGRVDAE